MFALETIDRPVMIVAGDRDRVQSPDGHAKRFATRIKGAQLELVPGAGHYTFLDACTPAGKAKLPLFCVDDAGLDRDAGACPRRCRGARLLRPDPRVG